MAIRSGITLKLSDGRSLGFDECGDPAGVPVLLFHGTPGSRIGLAGGDQDGIASDLGVRLVAIDRPGHGLSDPRPTRTILDWPVDVAELADGLGLSRFHVLGAFGASGYVAACGYRIPHRLLAAGIVSGVRPADGGSSAAGLSTLERLVPWVLRRKVRKLGENLVSHPNTMVEQHLAELTEVDRDIWRDPRRRQQLLESWREAFRLGVDGPLLDFRLGGQGWGFSPGDITMVMNLWFGERDPELAADGRYLAAAFRRSEARVYPEEGGWSLLVSRLGEILEGLLATGSREARVAGSRAGV